MVVDADTRNPSAMGMFKPNAGFEPTNHVGGRWPTNLIFIHATGCRNTSGERLQVGVVGLNALSQYLV
jgi:hypothetical protein